MVKHGQAKKRRRGLTVRAKPRKHRDIRIVNAITHPAVKQAYDKNKSPSENLVAMGLQADANQFKVKRSPGQEKSCVALVGFMELPKRERTKRLSEQDTKYIEDCVNRHGTNYVAMTRDMKLNYNQLTENKLIKLHEKYKSEQAK